MAVKSTKILSNFRRFCAIRSVFFSYKRACSSYGKMSMCCDCFGLLTFVIFGVVLLLNAGRSE